MALFEGSSAKDWLSPEYRFFYQFPLPIPPVKQPKMSITNPVTNKQIDYYEVDIVPFKQQVYPNKGPASLVGYDGLSPGPTFLVPRGRETVVRFTNKATLPSAVHLHGSPSRAPWDGWAEDRIQPGEYKDYYYPNSQSARFLWYHDHAMDIVEPRKYRLRFLNAAVSRSFILYFRRQTGGANIPFQVIASDAGLLTGPITTSTLTMSMAERWEVVVDFSGYAGQNISLLNQKDVGKDTDYGFTDQVMRFIVGKSAAAADTSLVPARLRDVPFPPRQGDGVDRRFKFHRSNGEWQINGVGFSDVANRVLARVPDGANRVLARVPRGTVEIWEFENGGGGWTHPVHVHLVDFRILSRTKAKRPVLAYEAAGLKDVVWLDAGEVVRVEAHYAPWDGVYMFHCHNLIHEDHEMMAAFNVTALGDLGYTETSFADPMEARWRAVPVSAAAFQADAVVQKVQAMAALQPYNNEAEVLQRLDQYWAARGGVKMRRGKRMEQVDEIEG
uniref:Bilirubin oxidase n=1 Tax=Colletotrichum fructicola (strain Nara gc5) TaxID=1213859 RepID=L2G5G4_COLFN